MEEYSFEPENVRRSSKPITNENANRANLSLAKVYLWFALGLLITGVVSLGLPNLLVLLTNNVEAETLANAYIAMIIVSAVLMLPSFIIISVQAFRKNKGLILTSYIIYALCMGVLLSSLFLMLVGPGDGLNTICIAFLVTGGIFLLCGLVGFLTKKKNLSFLWPILLSVLLGVFAISIANFFIGSSRIYWITDFIIFGVMIIEVALDFHNVNKLADSGAFTDSSNLAIYCAFTLYVDFIYLFVKVLIYVLLSKRK